MAKIIPAQEAGLAEGVGRVRVSTSRARRGKILAVEHPIFGWVPYRQWALLRLVPENRILPAIIVGVSTFAVAKAVIDSLTAAGEILAQTVPGTTFPVALGLTGPLGAILGLLSPILFPDAPEDPMKMMDLLEPDFIEANTVPFYIGLLSAGLTLAGLDPGMALRAFAEILNALTPLT